MNISSPGKPAPVVLGNFVIYARHPLTARQVYDDVLASCADHEASGVVHLETGEDIFWVNLRNEFNYQSRS
jgi:hypothetical protein